MTGLIGHASANSIRCSCFLFFFFCYVLLNTLWNAAVVTSQKTMEPDLLGSLPVFMSGLVLEINCNLTKPKEKPS
jgi:hypothetical protein